MSKANQKFVQADEAVSPVIGVILMVAITVVLAAVVFVLVSNLSKTSEKAEDAAVTARSPSAGVIEITLVKGGEHAPYQFTTSNDPDYATITIDGTVCTVSAISASGSVPAEWSAGGVVRIVAGGSGCAGAFAAGDADVSVNVALAGTLVLSTSIDVQD